MSCIAGIFRVICSEIFYYFKLKLKEMKKFIFGLSVASVLSMHAVGQDVHFTQYFTSPLTLNPAMTGLVAEDLRFAANYRTQWASVSSTPYTTGTVSYDMAVLKDKLPQGDAIGIGILGLYDKSGSGGLTNTTVGLSLAYHKAFGRDRQQHISLGLQADYVQKTLDFSKLTFADMYNTGTGLIQNQTGEHFSNADLTYPDFNAGIMYSGKVSEHVTTYIGYSYYHITQPVESFLGDDNATIHNRQSVYLGGSFDMNENTVLYASALYQAQAAATEVMVGTAVGFILNPGHDMEYQKNTIFYLGGWYRYGDAICPYVGIEWSKMRIGISYDVNVSSFTPATGGSGAYELSLIYFGAINKHEKNPSYNWSCPKVF
jgi:type IX secretion system PorP/SprF family membrane protein